MARSIQFNIPQTVQQPLPLRINRLDGGVCYKYEPSLIKDNQSPYAINTMCDEQGNIQKRWGQSYVLDSALDGSVNALYDLKTEPGYIRLIHAGTKLYKLNGWDSEELYDGLSDNRSAIFVFGNTCYILDGNKYYSTDGDTVEEVVGYIPTLTLGRTPAGGASDPNNPINEPLNCLSDSWTDSFSAGSTDSSTTLFYLSFAGITSVDKVVVNGATKTVTADYTVNLTTGVVTFTTAPGAGTNHVQITATKNGLMNRDEVQKHRFVQFFGGKNDTRIFLCGDGSNAVRWSSLMRADYFPEDNFVLVGSDNDICTGFIPQYDQLICLKERSIYRVEYEGGSTESLMYGFYPINSFVGCDMPYSIQLVDNIPIFCNTYAGVHLLLRTDVRTERNVFPMSGNVNRNLTRTGLLDLNQAILKNASSVDFDGKYVLNTGLNTFVWDYRLNPFQGNEDTVTWYHWRNISSKCWLVAGRDLFYGNSNSQIVKIGNHTRNDFAEPIIANWKSKLFYFDAVEWLKTIKEVYFRTKESINTNLTIRYFTDEGEELEDIIIATETFTLNGLDLDMFTLSINSFPPVYKLRPKLKKVVYFQFEIFNHSTSQDLTLVDLTINYSLTKKVK